MRLSRTSFVFATALTVGLMLHPRAARSADVIQSGDRVVPNERVTESVALRDVTVDGGIVAPSTIPFPATFRRAARRSSRIAPTRRCPSGATDTSTHR